jgi:tRNA (guanine-N7-)-methyltransferase
MPHLHIKEFKEIDFPQSIEGISFDFIAKNANHDDEWLISVSVEALGYDISTLDYQGEFLSDRCFIFYTSLVSAPL